MTGNRLASEARWLAGVAVRVAWLWVVAVVWLARAAWRRDGWA